MWRWESVMAGVKAGIASAAQNVGEAGTPAANAGQNEPSIDDILASIRQIISEQNRQADNAAEKAAAEVANKVVAPANIESIIGTVAADHWSGGGLPNSGKREEGIVRPVSSAMHQAVTSAHQSGNPSELEELIQLIGSTPPAPRAPTPTKWIDPQSNATSIARSAPPAVAGSNRPLVADVSPPKAPANTSGVKPPVLLAAKDKPVIPSAETRPAVRLHPSVSPKTDVPQVIKDAIVRPAMDKVALTPKAAPPKAAEIDKPMVSPKSALDRLIAKQKGNVAGVKEPAVATPPQPKPVAAAAAVMPARTQAKAPAVTTSPVQATKACPPPAAVSAKAVNAAVVKSIERLATSMFADRKDEIDGMMAGIVRPMLQDWLEDNLPSLVERIVREEIERVSRGVH